MSDAGMLEFLGMPGLVEQAPHMDERHIVNVAPFDEFECKLQVLHRARAIRTDIRQDDPLFILSHGHAQWLEAKGFVHEEDMYETTVDSSSASEDTRKSYNRKRYAVLSATDIRKRLGRYTGGTIGDINGIISYFSQELGNLAISTKLKEYETLEKRAKVLNMPIVSLRHIYFTQLAHLCQLAESQLLAMRATPFYSQNKIFAGHIDAETTLLQKAKNFLPQNIH